MDPDESLFTQHWARAPLQYVARRLPEGAAPLTIDGNLEKAAWTEVEWSDSFGDIRGADDAPAGSQPTAAQRTRMKMRWDDDYLYVAARLESDSIVPATFTERNSAIFTQDADFELFVDPSASTHAYKEFEVNALNTVWNLMLDRPYGDNGTEHSARVANSTQEEYYEVTAQQSATVVEAGAINSTSGATWAVELAMAHTDTLLHQPAAGQLPAVGRKWRINFSRVEKKGDINWVWSPQIVWDAEAMRHAGKVAMHLPDAWGWVQFAPSGGAPPTRDATWPARLAALNVYYAQHRRLEVEGTFTASAQTLAPYLDEAIVQPFDITIEADGNNTFTANVTRGQLSVRVRNDRFVEVLEGE